MKSAFAIAIVLAAAAVTPRIAEAAPVVVREVATGSNHACALLANGGIKCWGDNASGQLGLGDAVSRGGDPADMGDELPYVDLVSKSALQISLGANHSCALSGKGVVHCWGNNDAGQLGVGDTAARGDDADEMGVALPAVALVGMADQVAAGGAHSCALMDTGKVKCWGANFSGQLGRGDTRQRGDGPLEMGPWLAYVNLGTGRTAVQITAGLAHTCALLDDASVKCWGNNGSGQLGQEHDVTLGDTANEMGDFLPTIDLGPGRTALAVEAGFDHTCVLLDTEIVKCFGENASGQLGLGDDEDRGDDANEMGSQLDQVLMGISLSSPTLGDAGSAHSCALLGTQLKCWGENANGELGIGADDDRGDGPNEMFLDLQAADLGSGVHAVQVSTGWNFTCALLDDDRVKCWGANAFGQLGVGDRSIRGRADDEMGDALPYVELGEAPSPPPLVWP
jgi:alpha-tubulin suppressor-like RCC1 family protein